MIRQRSSTLQIRSQANVIEHLPVSFSHLASGLSEGRVEWFQLQEGVICKGAASSDRALRRRLQSVLLAVAGQAGVQASTRSRLVCTIRDMLVLLETSLRASSIACPTYRHSQPSRFMELAKSCDNEWTSRAGTAYSTTPGRGNALAFGSGETTLFRQ
jgi:hypothetical protein